MARDEETMLDMLGAARHVVDFTGGMEKEDFLTDTRTQSAVLHQLLVLGEAVKRLSAEFRERNAAIPCKSIAGMRDKLIHGYNAVDLEEVWKTAVSDIPELIRALEPLAPETSP